LLDRSEHACSLKGSHRTELKHVWSQDELLQEATEVTAGDDETIKLTHAPIE